MAKFVVSGTGTEIGKSVFAAGLAGMLGATYWKPVQAGLDDGLGDRDRVTNLAGVPTLPERYQLTEPLSPHRAAEIDGVVIDPGRLTVPDIDPLIIEGAGGVMVPLTRTTTFADLFAVWNVPVILCATTSLGTISHSLTAFESLTARGVPVHGFAFIGDDNPDNIRTICEMTGAPNLGRLPWLASLDRPSLRAAMRERFNPKDFM